MALRVTVDQELFDNLTHGHRHVLTTLDLTEVAGLERNRGLKVRDLMCSCLKKHSSFSLLQHTASSTVFQKITLFAY